MAITLRSTKGAALTYNELDGNFTDLDNRTKEAWAMDGLEPTVREGLGNPAELTQFYNGIYAYSYAADSLSESFANWDVPLSWAPGTDLYLAFHWSPGNSNASGSVRWCIEYTGATVDGMFFEPITEVYDSSHGANMPYHHHQVVSTPFPANQVEPNMRFLLRIYRDGANVNDTFPAPAFLLGVDFYYKQSKFGTPSFEPPYT